MLALVFWVVLIGLLVYTYIFAVRWALDADKRKDYNQKFKDIMKRLEDM